MDAINLILDEQRREDENFQSESELGANQSKMPSGKVDSKILEERAVSEATASADATFSPSPSAMSSNSSENLLSQVDGPSLTDYKVVPSVYMARSVPVALRGSFTVPIYVTAGGSVVEYTVECENHDIGFGITAEREEGVTIVSEDKRVDAHLEPVTGKFLVGGIPCVLHFRFDNGYSWMTEKRVTYKVTITPPHEKHIIAGRRRRAKIALRVVEEDLKAADDRLNFAQESKTTMEKEVALLEKELLKKKKALETARKEETLLMDRIKVRKEQVSLLNNRLENGWDDETKPSNDIPQDAPTEIQKKSSLTETNRVESGAEI